MHVAQRTLEPGGTTRQIVSVVICAYTLDRWNDVLAALGSVRRQTAPAREIIVVVDHNPDLLAKLCGLRLPITVVENAEQQGLSGARNTGVRAAIGEIVAFLDDDATAADDWLAKLILAYGDPDVFGTGGSVEPRWEVPPRDLPEELNWVVGCSYRGLPTKRANVRNPIGANMSFRRDEVITAGGFHHSLGRIGTLPSGCEETELCIRIRRRSPLGRVVYEPEARVSHRVPQARTTWRYFVARCYAEGLSKAFLTRLAGARAGLASERTYVFRTLPRGFLMALSAGVWRRDAGAFGRAGRIVTGITVTTAGFAIGGARALLDGGRDG